MDAATDVRNLDLKRRTAMVAADVGTLDDLLDDDLIWIHGSGKADGKAALLKAIGSNFVRYVEMEVVDQSTRDFGSFVILSGILKMTAELYGERRELQNRFTIVWAYRESRWRAVNWQSTAFAG